MSKYFTASAYYSVCPFVRIGSPAPSTVSGCVPPWNQRGGGQHSHAGRGEPIRTTGAKALHSEYSEPAPVTTVHKIHTVHSVRPLFGIGTPHPVSSKRVCPSPRTKGGGGHNRLRLRGWGVPFGRLEKNLALCLFYAPVSKIHILFITFPQFIVSFKCPE